MDIAHWLQRTAHTELWLHARGLVAGDRVAASESGLAAQRRVRDDGVLEAKKEDEDPLKGMQQAKRYADCKCFDVNYVFSTNGHRYGEFDYVTSLQAGLFPFTDFPPHTDLCARYARDTGIDMARPEAGMLFQADSPAWSLSRYYQDAAIRAAFEKILRDTQSGKSPRVLLSLATGAGKTVIAANLLWRLSQAGQLPKPALFLCDRDELRTQAYGKLTAAFGDNARIVKLEQGGNAARNARVHIATYQTLGLDDDDEGFASFLTEHYGEDAFSVIVIDECHRSAWGKWSVVLERNPRAIQIGLTATPCKLEESDHGSAEDLEITANNRKYFGEPLYEYTLIQAQEDGYLAACEIVRRKASIDRSTFTKADILKAGARDIKTGQLLTEAFGNNARPGTVTTPTTPRPRSSPVRAAVCCAIDWASPACARCSRRNRMRCWRCRNGPSATSALRIASRPATS